MIEQHPASHDGERRKRDHPSHSIESTKPPENFDGRSHDGQHTIELVLKNFMIAAIERLGKGERAYGPGFVVAPEEKEQAHQSQRTGQEETRPQGGRSTKDLA